MNETAPDTGLTWIDCGPPANQSEEIAKVAIHEWFRSHPGLGHWIVLSNLMISYKPYETPDEVDLVAIGPSGVLAIEIKHWGSEFFTKNPDVVNDEAHRIESKARRMGSKVKKIQSDAWVVSKFLFTKANKPPAQEVEGVSISVLKDLSHLFSPEPRRLMHPVNRFAEILVPAVKTNLSGKLSRFHGIENLTLVSPPKERFHREYRGVKTKDRESVILHWYDLTSTNHKMPTELAEREFRVYQVLQKESFVPRVLDSFQPAVEYPGEVYFFTIADPTAPTLEERSTDSRWTRDDRIRFAIECVLSLKRMHSEIERGDNGGAIFHRGITPKSVLVTYDGHPIFNRFQWAKLTEAQTIASGSLAPHIAARFTPPEVAAQGLGNADGRSDIYSLCESLKIAFAEDDQVLALLARGTVSDPGGRATLDDLEGGFRDLLRPQDDDEPRQERILPQYWSEGTEVSLRGDDERQVFQVLEKLGFGGIGQTFKVVQVDRDTREEFGLYVAKTINNQADAKTALRSYWLARPALKEGAATIYEVAHEWDPTRPMAILRWVSGDPLASYAGVLALQADDLGISLEELLVSWITATCRALQPLHLVGLVHGDVSPGNIIVDGSTVTLTDYDAVTRSGEPVQHFNPKFASPQIKAGSNSSCSDDIFAVAATFASVLCDQDPFLWDSTLAPDRGINLDTLSAFELGRLKEFFARAASPDPSERFVDAFAAVAFLSEVPLELPVPRPPLLEPKVAVRLTEILNAYPGSKHGNIETRGLDSPFAKDTYVETSLDAQLLADVSGRKVAMVILLGNAGDGKTAILQRLLKRLGCDVPSSSQRVWETDSPTGKHLYVNLDGSAMFDGRSSQELLDEFFAPYLGDELPDERLHILAINSGPLKQWLSRAEDSYLVRLLHDVLLGKPMRDTRIRIVDLNARSLVGRFQEDVLTTEFIDALLDRFLTSPDGSDPWDVCHSCSAQSRCTAFHSVSSLRDSVLGPQIRLRFSHLLQMVHQRGVVHVTARELRSAVSYSFFGIDSCDDLHSEPDSTPREFFDRVFEISDGRQGELLRELAWLDPALELEPELDRHLVRSGLPLATARRRAYFFEPNQKRIPVLHQGRYYQHFLELCRPESGKSASVMNDLLDGLSRIGNLPHLAYDASSGLSLKVPARAETESVFWVEKPRESFRIRVGEGSDLIDWLPVEIDLVYSNRHGGENVLTMGLELFDFLMAAHDGARPPADIRSSDMYGRLDIFMQRLAEEDRRRIEAWTPLHADTIYTIEVDASSGRHRILIVEGDSRA